MHKSRLKLAIPVILLATFMMIALIYVMPSDSVADAVLPCGYISDVIESGLEWWTAESFVDLANLKRTVDGWKADSAFDFEYLKKNPVKIAVIDSGVNLEHELFSGKYDSSGNSDLTAVSSNGVGLYDVIYRDASGKAVVKNTAAERKLSYRSDDVTDDERQLHGTHVAGIIAVLIHALELEQYIKIIPIKASYHAAISNEDKFESSDVKEAIDFALTKGADVINMSLSAEGKNFAGLNTSNAHKSAVLVAAAGNDGAKVLRYPAALPNVIGVMNYTYKEDKPVLSITSNYGYWSDVNLGYDICAPGTEIQSANGKFTSGGEYGYKELSGTSMSAPIVSFGAGLLAMKFRALSGQYFGVNRSEEIADYVRIAFTSTLEVNEKDSKIGEFKVFDINELAGVELYDSMIFAPEAAQLKQRLGSLRPIELSLKVISSSDLGKGSVKWYIGDELIGEGFEISHMPASEAGKKIIKAVWSVETSDGVKVLESEIGYSVDYMLVSAETVKNMEISASVGGKAVSDLTACRVGTTYSFDVAVLGNIPAADAANCKWIVNGSVAQTGASFEFTPESVGTYEIKLSLYGFESESITLNAIAPEIDKEHKTELRIFTIVFCTALGAAAIAITVLIVIKYSKKGSRKGR